MKIKSLPLTILLMSFVQSVNSREMISFDQMAEITVQARVCQQAMNALDNPEMATQFEEKARFFYKVVMEVHPTRVEELMHFSAYVQSKTTQIAKTYEDWDKINVDFRCINTYLSDKARQQN
ncbi:hypothetical protein ACPV48_25300 [Vibrio harveyi]|uniref:hypothetical protein n=1 Tax=Vibrio harveyi TaxID=669 RepID=UPI00406830A0